MTPVFWSHGWLVVAHMFDCTVMSSIINTKLYIWFDFTFLQILFEVLYKNPYILKTPALIELHCLSGKGAENVPYARSIFSNSKALLVAKFSRLSVLDNVPGVSALRLSSDHSHDFVRSNPPKDDDASSIETESVESTLSEEGIANKIRQGIWCQFRIVIFLSTIQQS